MSFWAQNPGPTWSDYFWSFFICTDSVHAFPINRTRLTIPTGAYIHTLCCATERDSEKIATFLQENFQITARTSCVISAEQIRQGIAAGWYIIYAAGGQGDLMGCIISRPLGECRFFERRGEKLRSSSVRNAGFIDFFCVLPSLQKSGLGSALLKYVRYRTSQQERFVHFFQKELTPIRALPPIWSGYYIARSVENTSNYLVRRINIDNEEWPHYDAIKLATATFAVGTRTDKLSQDTQLFRYNANAFSYSNGDRSGIDFYVVITDTFSVEKGTDRRMGEVLSWWAVPNDGLCEPSIKETANAIEIILNSSGYQIILMDSTFPHDEGWTTDAPYYYYIYNLNPRRFFNLRPWFWF